jgi:hypothetical protein
MLGYLRIPSVAGQLEDFEKLDCFCRCADSHASYRAKLISSAISILNFPSRQTLPGDFVFDEPALIRLGPDNASGLVSDSLIRTPTGLCARFALSQSSMGSIR